MLFISNVSGVNLVANWSMSVKYLQLKGLCCFFSLFKKGFLEELQDLIAETAAANLNVIGNVKGTVLSVQVLTSMSLNFSQFDLKGRVGKLVSM